MSGLFGKVNRKQNSKENCVFDWLSSSACIVAANGTVQRMQLNVNQDELHELAHNRDLVVFVPGEDVFTTRVELPKMSQSRLKKAIPFALEDQVIDDLAALHFADFVDVTMQSVSSGRYVMVVAHEKMRLWLEKLNAMQVTPIKVLPTYAALHGKVEDNSDVVATIWVTPQDLVLCHVEDKYFASDSENISLYLAQFPAIKKILIKNFTSNTLALPDLWLKEEEFIPATDYIMHLARGYYDCQSPINLLQNQYAFKASTNNNNHKLQQKSYYLLYASIFLLLLYPAVPYFYLKTRVNVVNQRIATIYKAQFPQAQNIVAPKQRLEEKLLQLKMKNGGDKFFYLLANLSKVLPQINRIKLQRLDYQNNQLTLRILAGASDDIADFSDLLSKQGLNVKQQNTTLVGENVHAAIQIE